MASRRLHCMLVFVLCLTGCRWTRSDQSSAVTWPAPRADVGSQAELVALQQTPAPTDPFVVPSTTVPGQVPASQIVQPNLADCLRFALESQPRLAAQQATLAAAEDSRRAIEKLHIPASLTPAIPVRLKQATLGVAAAAAGLDLATRETVYAVTRTYFAVLYAREQETIAQGVVERLTAAKDAAAQALKAGDRDATAADVSRTTVYLRLAEARRVQASQGVKKAMAALREACGMGDQVVLETPAGRLPAVDPKINRDEIVAAALARRGDLMQVRIFSQLACLEVDAQSSGFTQRMQTFASGSNINSVPVPQGSRSPEYRPGAVPPEMPATLVGSRKERVKHAQTLSARAEAVVETTRNLIVLEADEALLRFEEASQQARHAKEAAEVGEKLADELRKDFAAGLKVKVEEVVTARVLAAQAQAEYNEYHFKQIVAMADLERIAAGGFSAGLVQPSK